MAGEGIADRLGEDAAAAERDRAPAGALERREHGRLLAAAELGLALALEEGRDRLAELGLEQAVGVDRLGAGGAAAAIAAFDLPAPMKPMKTSERPVAGGSDCGASRSSDANRSAPDMRRARRGRR